jgi:hypothetical protein
MTITLTREEAQQVLDALADAAGCVQENYQPGHLGHGWSKQIETLRARLAQPEPEPVAWMNEDASVVYLDSLVSCKHPDHTPLYTAPPQREWQGLTDEEAEILIDAHWEDLLMLIELIEAKLKQKNA